MGNSQKGIKNKVREFFSKREDHPEIKQNRICPKCLNAFPGVTPDFYALHVETCKDGLKQPDILPKPIQQSLQPEHIKITNQTVEHLFEKVPTNPQKTQFKWIRVPTLKPNINALINIPAQQIAKKSFQQKLAWMRAHLQRLRISWEYGADIMKIEKDNVLMTSITASAKVNMHKEVKVQFADDKVNDAGGLLREWMHMIIKQMFDETGIFERTNTPEVMYKIKWDKDLDEQFATALYSLFGTILGKAIFQRTPLTCYLDRTLLRHICGQPINLEDISGYDKDFYKNWKYLATHKIQPFGQYFVLMKEHGDHTIQNIPLIPQGENVELNEQNKHLFIKRCIDFYCTESVLEYIKVIQKSLYKIVPQQYLSVFEPYEIQMILYGVPFVNVDDWKNNTDYKGAYYKNHQIIKWFWNSVGKMSQEQLCNLLHFITGSSRIPIYGFQKLQSNRGNYAKFLIESIAFNKLNPYPKAHTCFNRMQLPMYPTQELLHTYLMAIVNNNLDGVYGLD